MALAELKIRPIATAELQADRPLVVVSVTTFAGRAALVHRTLGSLLKQSEPADRVVLVLARSEFPDVPVMARQFVDNPCFEILWVEANTRSYKKLLPALERYPGSVIVTADDDVIYPRHWLRTLLETHRTDSRAVVCGRGLAMPNKWSADPAYPFPPYATWQLADPSTDPELVFPTGVSGILYPPNCLDARVLDAEAAQRTCPDGDDIWFKVMALLAGTGARAALSRPDLPGSQLARGGAALTTTNVAGGRNDENLRAAWRAHGAEIASRWRS